MEMVPSSTSLRDGGILSRGFQNGVAEAVEAEIKAQTL